MDSTESTEESFGVIHVLIHTPQNNSHSVEYLIPRQFPKITTSQNYPQTCPICQEDVSLEMLPSMPVYAVTGCMTWTGICVQFLNL